MTGTFIILINYNNHNDTLKCLTSIKEAGYSNNVVVVDNNSTVEGIDEIREKFPSTILLKNDMNIGFGRANNVGIDWVTNNTVCEFIFILNNDTTINKDTINYLERMMKKNKNIGIVSPKIAMMDLPDRLWYGGGCINWKKGSATIPGYLADSNSELACITRKVEFASGCAMLVRRSVIECIGGFDRRFFMYEEDLEFCCRAREHGWEIWYVSDALVLHKCQGSLRKKSELFNSIWSPKNPNLPFYMYQITKNRMQSMHLHAKGKNRFYFFTIFPCILILKSIQFLYFRRFDGIKAIYLGIKDFLYDIT